MNRIYLIVSLFIILIIPNKSYSQGETYLLARDSASMYFDKMDFVKAKTFFKVCVATDDYKRSDYYYLASCFSKLNLIDSSAHYFAIALSLGLRSGNVEKIDMDTNIDNLIKSKWWKDLKKRFVENSTRKIFLNESLRSSLAERAKLDQQYSQQYRLNSEVDANAWKLQETINRRNQVWLDSVVANHGWPSISIVGEEGCIHAWLIVQHADDNPEYQKKYLELVKKLIKTNDIPLSNFAYLQDRVLVNECKPQIYGTQYSAIYAEDGSINSIEFKPINDSKLVDKRRRYMNMVSLEEYRLEALKSYKKR